MIIPTFTPKLPLMKRANRFFLFFVFLFSGGIAFSLNALPGSIATDLLHYSKEGGRFESFSIKTNGSGCKNKDPKYTYKDSEDWVESTRHYKVDNKIELIDLKEFELQLSPEEWHLFHSDLKKCIDDKNFEVIEKLCSGTRFGGTLEFKSMKAWEFALDFPLLRIKTEVLERLSTKFGNVLGDIKNVNKDFVESTVNHLDLGGHNRYPNAVKLSFEDVDYAGNPIRNLIQGNMKSNLPKIPSSQMDRITIENAPFFDDILSEVKRVTKSKGTIELEHPTGTIPDYNVIAIQVDGVVTSTQTFTKHWMV